MAILLLILFTQFISAVVGAVMLIQQGGFGRIFVGILLIVNAMLNTSIVLASGLLDSAEKSRKKGGDLK